MKPHSSDWIDLDEGGFQLPVAELFADLDSGSASVQLSREFKRAPVATQLQAIADWQRRLAQMRVQAFEQLYREIEKSTDDGAERARRFAAACRELGQAWPPELAARVQAASGSARRST
jgi:hypothetical protein